MKIEELKGVGEKTSKLFNNLNINNVEDLIDYYPRDYSVFSAPKTIDAIDDEKIVSIRCKLSNKPVLMAKGRFKMVSTVIVDEHNNRLQTVWYNMPYIAKSLVVGEIYIFRGIVQKNREGKPIKFVQPEIYTEDKYKEKLNSRQPIYSLTKGLSNNMVTKMVKEAFSVIGESYFDEYLPDDVIEQKQLYSIKDAVYELHFPKNEKTLLEARRRLVFDEFLIFILAIRAIKGKNEAVCSDYVIKEDERTLNFINSLPYKLTNAQQKVLKEVSEDIASGYLMNRLIQGDVGSGKTIVALIALINTAFAGYQGALMAPTEVLANQHYENICEMFKEYNIPLNVVLLTGAMTAKDKRISYEMIENGTADIIIGTHALIVEKVKYKNLGLVITDEQHRFGVAQRKTLSLKGMNPHILVMSATPIPRTLAIILYGELDVSVIDELPGGRLPIKNCVVTKDFRTNAYNFIKNQVKEGHQVYVICPLVEESENLDVCDVISYSKEIQEALGNEIVVRYLHGKQKSKEKNEIMEAFAANEINVLVSTTVIEVGINVPNATVMMVENAERFGLAALHQLRGRVGRGNSQSYCIFVSGSKSKEKLERLEILNKTNDGFKIANEDLKLRGPGDLFGVRQSGELDFKIGDIYADSQELKEAYEYAIQIEKRADFESENFSALRRRIEKFIRSEMGFSL